MSLIDDLKNLFSYHAETLDKRMGVIEDHLSKIAEDNDTSARQIDYESRRMNLTNVINEPMDLLTIPAGSFYELTQIAFENAAENVRVAVYVNGIIADATMTGAKQGISRPNELVFMENDKVTVKLVEGTTATVVQFMFKTYEVAPKAGAHTGSGG